MSFQSGRPATEWQHDNNDEIASIESELKSKSGSAKVVESYNAHTVYVDEIPSIPVTSAAKFDFFKILLYWKILCNENVFLEGQQNTHLQK